MRQEKSSYFGYAQHWYAAQEGDARMMTIASLPGPQKKLHNKKPHPFQNGAFYCSQLIA